MSGKGYSFTVQDARARNDQILSNPQYNYRVGYYITDKIVLSIGLDHMKYIVKNNQRVRLTGSIDSSSSKAFGGRYDNEQIVLTDDFLHFEHTDGLNYLSLELELTKSYALTPDNKFSFGLMAGPGLGMVIPRIDVTLFGSRINNNYHVSGWGASLKWSNRLNLFRHFFIQGDVKAGYAHLSDVLLTGDTGDRPNQSFGFLERCVLLGVSFSLKK